MAKKFGEPGENLVQGAGRFGGSSGSGNVPSGGTSRMSRLDYADSLERARKLSKKADDEMLAKEKAAGIQREAKMRDTAEDKRVAKLTQKGNSGSVTPKREDSDNVYSRRHSSKISDAIERRDLDFMKKGGKVSSASKRADGCALRGKTRA